MKKFLFVMLSALFAVNVAAQSDFDRNGTLSNGITWSYTFNNMTLTISGQGNITNFAWNEAPWLTEVLYEEVETKKNPITGKVTETITYYYLRDYVNHLVISQGINSIGTNSFANMINIESATLSSSITSIGDNAFLGCTNLKLNWNNINENINISGTAFSGCNNIVKDNSLYINGILVKVFPSYNKSSLNIATGTTKILANAVANITTISNITIPESVTTIGNNAFEGTKISKITIPSSVTSIGADAFDGCSNLTTVTFNANVKTFGNWFEGLSKLTTINIPASVTTISNNAFNGCTSLTNVTFGNISKITSWGSNIFNGVTGKKDGDYMMIGNSVILKAISNSAPDARYEISNNVAYIADNAFADVNNSTVYLDLRDRDNAPVLASSALNGIAGFKTIVKNGKEGNFNSKVWSNINTTTIEVPSEKYTTCMFMYNAVVPEGIAVYTAKSNAEGKVVLTKINKNNARTVVPAGVGFMLRADNKTTATFVSAKNEDAVSVNENELKGAEDYTYFTGDENPYVYILSTVDGKQGFYRAGSTNKLKIGKAYLQSNTQIHSLAKMSLWEGESETSGISDAQMSENSNAKGYVYNLNGSRMSSPQKGVNIINGKKVIIK